MNARDLLLSRVIDGPLKDLIPPHMIAPFNQLIANYSDVTVALIHIGDYFPDARPAMNGQVPLGNLSMRLAQFVHDVLWEPNELASHRISAYVPPFYPDSLSEDDVRVHVAEYVKTRPLPFELTIGQIVSEVCDEKVARTMRFNQELNKQIEYTLSELPERFTIYDFYMKMHPRFCNEFAW